PLHGRGGGPPPAVLPGLAGRRLPAGRTTRERARRHRGGPGLRPRDERAMVGRRAPPAARGAAPGGGGRFVRSRGRVRPRAGDRAGAAGAIAPAAGGFGAGGAVGRCGGAGRRNEARGLLEPVYRAFEEGLDTSDLVRARGLLAGLAESP